MGPSDGLIGRPRPRRTMLAVTLQLGRGVEDLVVLIREGARSPIGRQAAVRLAATIARGARDRSREQQPAVSDQQRRNRPLREPRPATRRGKSLKETGREAIRVAA